MMRPGPIKTLPMLAAVVTGMACLSCGTVSEDPPEPPGIVDFQILSDSSGCCPDPIAPALGVLAALTPGPSSASLKVACGCRSVGDTAELGAIVELRARDKDGRIETFEAIDLVTAPDCGASDESWGLAAYRAIRRAADVWAVTGLQETGLCALLDDPTRPRDVTLRALEEAALRKSCVDQVERLALSDDEQVALRSVGTLGRIGSRQSLKLLGSLTLSSGAGMPWAATHAISDIGGTDAARALEIVAQQATTSELRIEAARLAAGIRDAAGPR
ncbi:MAG TPA: HEAT repeat domain-containing protein [Myxococcota bacterium]|nr:HEAT repeat domain-containing protein [Myxococcota bacterium]HNZ03434.1 HEAT repeat domain-containing protein [Myxococcota bacterium]HPB49734.1 HEAT repeat domain-containing protein [Myxococcota bacterium]HQP94734.1 HEAT repeat domain-containing protein [Myxococcota bacterium]